MKDVALFAWAASLAIISLSERVSGYSAISEGYAFALRSFINAFFSSYIDVRTRIALKDRLKPTLSKARGTQNLNSSPLRCA